MYQVKRRYDRVPLDVVEAYQSVSAASAHEASGRRGALTPDIKPIYEGMRVCGTALTVQGHPGDNLILLKALEVVQPGEVIVAAFDGWKGGPWGENMTAAAVGRGCTGLVIDGYVRDGIGIKQLGFPIFARGLCMKGAVKATLGLINHPVVCGGEIVQPGDLVLGDDDGVCIVPRERAAPVLERALEREGVERVSREAYLAGDVSGLAKYWRIASDIGLTEEPVDELGSDGGAADTSSR